jgi:hypothetical protein
MHVPPTTRRAFLRRCPAVVAARFGPTARDSAADALGRPDRLDLFGAAHLAGVAPIPANVPVAVERYARETGLDD